VVIDFDDPASAWDRLGVAYRIEAEFIVWEADDVIQVPTSALFRLEGEWSVYVVENGHARMRAVERGRVSGLSSQVISGLQPGDVIITHPGDRIADGVRVRPD